jgi:hypothetical protein
MRYIPMGCELQCDDAETLEPILISRHSKVLELWKQRGVENIAKGLRMKYSIECIP